MPGAMGTSAVSSHERFIFVMCVSVIIGVSISVKKHHSHGNSYKGKHLTGVAYCSEAQSVIIIVGHGA